MIDYRSSGDVPSPASPQQLPASVAQTAAQQQPSMFGGVDPFRSVTQPVQPQQPTQPESQPASPFESQVGSETEQPSTRPDQPANAPQSSQADQNQQKSDPFDHLPKPVPERVLLSWQAPSRIFKKRSRQYFATIVVIGLLISLILLFAGQFLPIAVVLSVVFLVYILSTVPPSTVSHKISNYGIWVENNLYFWEEMGRYWYTEKLGQTLLNIEIARFPGRITLLMGTTTKEELDDLLSQVLINEKPAPTFFDRAADWIEKNIPLDKE